MTTTVVRFLGALRTLQQAIQVAAQVPGSDVYGAFESIELQKLGFLAGMGGAALQKTVPAPVLAWARDADSWAQGLALRAPLRFSGQPTDAVPAEWITQFRRQVAAGQGVLPPSHAAMAALARALQAL
jgi:hypothetical protein